MRYVSIDIETTGLDPERDQVLEFAAVIEDPADPQLLAELPRFERIVRNERITGNSIALHMNARLLTALALDERGERCVHAVPIVRPYHVWSQFHNFLHNNGLDPSKPVVVAGKNFAAFDLSFIRKQLPGQWKFQHRVLDPMMLYVDLMNDEMPPDTKECMKRTSIDPAEFNLHTAVDDALLVIELIRRGTSRGRA